MLPVVSRQKTTSIFGRFGAGFCSAAPADPAPMTAITASNASRRQEQTNERNMFVALEGRNGFLSSHFIRR
jgi:hypothetical protein